MSAIFKPQARLFYQVKKLYIYMKEQMSKDLAFMDHFNQKKMVSSEEG